ncbi:MAG: response regulator [Micropruina sp.]
MSKSRSSVLLVEDDAVLRRSLAQWLSLNDLEVVEAGGGKDALKALENGGIDVVISDVRMRGMNGLELLEIVHKDRPGLPVIILSGHGDVPMAVSAMQGGAFTFLTKPYVPEQLLGALRNALEQARLRERVVSLERGHESRSLIDERLLGEDPLTLAVKAMLAQLAAYPVDVLIIGETGTGKEVDGAAPARLQRAARRSLRRHQLRGTSGRYHRERAVRPRGRRLHRRLGHSGRQAGVRQQGNPVSRRG